MRLVGIKEILGLEAGEAIPAVRGRLKAIFEQKTGTNTNGEWALQNGTLTDGTAEVKITFKDRAAIPMSWRGRELLLQCVSGDKGLTGVKAKDDDYKGKVTRIIYVTPSATVEELEAGPAADQPPAPAQPSSLSSEAESMPWDKRTDPKPPPPPPEPPPHQAAPSPKATTGAQDVKRQLNRTANLYLDCLLAGSYVREQWGITGHTMTDEQFQSCVSSLFIQSTRDNHHTQVAGGVWSKQP